MTTFFYWTFHLWLWLLKMYFSTTDIFGQCYTSQKYTFKLPRILLNFKGTFSITRHKIRFEVRFVFFTDVFFTLEAARFRFADRAVGTSSIVNLVDVRWFLALLVFAFLDGRSFSVVSSWLVGGSLRFESLACFVCFVCFRCSNSRPISSAKMMNTKTKRRHPLADRAAGRGGFAASSSCFFPSLSIWNEKKTF